MERYKHLEKAMCRELEALNRKYSNEDAEISEQDATRADKLYHALKCAETYHAMKSAEDWDGENEYSRDSRSYRGASYARYRNPRTGRYVSRDGGDDGYSGHHPMEYIDPNWDRRY